MAKIRTIVIEESKMYYGTREDIKALYGSMIRSGKFFPLYENVNFSEKNSHYGIITESVGNNDNEDYLRVLSSDTVLGFLI